MHARGPRGGGDESCVRTSELHAPRGFYERSFSGSDIRAVVALKILLTGSSGFIGSYLTETLQDRRHVVVGIDREVPGWSRPDEFVHGDLLDDRTLERAFDDIDGVFHLAAAKDDWGISRQEYFRDNVEATRKLLAVGREQSVERWFHYSTVGVLPRGPQPLDEEAPLGPETDYGASKAEAERLFRRFSRENPGYAVSMLRPSAVFGPRHPPTTNVYRLIEAIRDGRFVMVGDGDTLKTTSYIVNLLEATLFLFDRIDPGLKVYHYVDAPVMTTERLVNEIYRLLSKRRPTLRVPLGLARPLAYVSDVAASALGVDFPITAARIEKFCTPTHFDASAIRGLGFTQPVANERALAKTVRWHRERRA